MKAISEKQPWASLIIEGVKDIENRTWKCPEKYIGQRVLVHASAYQKLDKMPLDMVFSQEQLAELYSKFTEYQLCERFGPFGAIIGSVEIVDCVINHPSIWAEKQHCTHHTPCKDLRTHPNCWDGCICFSKPIYNWVLANPVKFPEPIPAKGKLGFWEFDLKCPEFSHFGASYSDARCIDGYLWDLDSADGCYLTKGGDDPCPYCKPNEYLECYSLYDKTI